VSLRGVLFVLVSLILLNPMALHRFSQLLYSSFISISHIRAWASVLCGVNLLHTIDLCFSGGWPDAHDLALFVLGASPLHFSGTF
jgi:hypothetical protein